MEKFGIAAFLFGLFGMLAYTINDAANKIAHRLEQIRSLLASIDERQAVVVRAPTNSELRAPGGR